VEKLKIMKNKRMDSGLPPSLIKAFYTVKPMVPRDLQLFARRQLARVQKHQQTSTWPIFPGSETLPPGWKGWKDNKQFALILTHDVDTLKGWEHIKDLMNIDRVMGFRSSFNIVPERYPIEIERLWDIKNQGFELGVHGLNHDGKLIQSEIVFLKRAKKINEYICEWDACGFRAPSMHCDLELFKCLKIAYDASTFDTDPFEPKSHGVHTIFPFAVFNEANHICYWELPYTLPQDSTLFIILQERTIDIWKQKLDWIAQNGGMALLNTHPDYMDFDGDHGENEDYPAKLYIDFLNYVTAKYCGQFWNPLPKDLVQFLNETYA